MSLTRLLKLFYEFLLFLRANDTPPRRVVYKCSTSVLTLHQAFRHWQNGQITLHRWQSYYPRSSPNAWHPPPELTFPGFGMITHPSDGYYPDSGILYRVSNVHNIKRLETFIRMVPLIKIYLTQYTIRKLPVELVEYILEIVASSYP